MTALNQPLVCPELIGREGVLAEIDAVAHVAAQGDGAVILVTGEAGVGKSRLLGAAAASLTRQGWRLVRGAFYEQDGGFAFAGVAGLLQSLLAAAPESTLTALQPYRSEVERLLPDLAAGDGTLPSLNRDPEQERRRIHLALQHSVAAACEEAPCMVEVEDLHWGDGASLDALLSLARAARSLRLVLLMSYRADEVSPPLRRFLAELDRERLAAELSLPHLSLPQVDTMLRATLKQQRSTRADFLHGLYQLTEGNPFFVEEVLRSLVAETGDLDLDSRRLSDLRVPRSILEAIRLRVEMLTPEARALLEIAAVAGINFDLALLSRVGDRHEDTLLPLIKELIAAQLVVEDREDRFAFRHALTREAIRGTLLARERRLLHRGIAKAITQGPDADNRLQELAYHFSEAQSWQEALDYALRADERARGLFAPGAAITNLSRAAEAAQQLGITVPAVLLDRAAAFDALGDFDAARRDYETALLQAEAAGDTTLLVSGLLGTGLLWSSRDYQRTRPYFERAVALSREMGDSRLLAQALSRLGNWYSNTGSYRQSRLCLDEALSIFRQLDDRRGVAETTDLLGMCAMFGADLEVSLRSFQEAARLFEAMGDKAGQIVPLATISVLSGTYQTDMLRPMLSLPEALPYLERAHALALETGVPSHIAYALFQLGFCLGEQGLYARALECAHESLAVSRQNEHRQWTTAALCVLGALYSDLLQPDQALLHLEEALRLSAEIGSEIWTQQSILLLTRTLLLAGAPDQAAQLLQQHASTIDGEPTIARAWRVTAEIELAVARGDVGQAKELVRLFEAISAPGPRIELLLAHMHALDGRKDDAAGALQMLVEALERDGNRSLLWRAQTHRAALLLETGRRDDARLAANAAQDVIDSLATGLTDTALRESFLAAAANHIPGALRRRPSRGQLDGLTAREAEVAAMVARGLSNRAIADELVLSSRTVETHIANATAKLGFSSRSQLAAWAAGHGLLDASPSH